MIPAGNYGLRGRNPDELPPWLLAAAAALFFAGVVWLRLKR